VDKLKRLRRHGIHWLTVQLNNLGIDETQELEQGQCRRHLVADI